MGQPGEMARTFNHSSWVSITSLGKMCSGLPEGKVEGSLDYGYWASKRSGTQDNYGAGGIWITLEHPDSQFPHLLKVYNSFLHDYLQGYCENEGQFETRQEGLQKSNTQPKCSSLPFAFYMSEQIY